MKNYPKVKLSRFTTKEELKNLGFEVDGSIAFLNFTERGTIICDLDTKEVQITALPDASGAATSFDFPYAFAYMVMRGFFTYEEV